MKLHLLTLCLISSFLLFVVSCKDDPTQVKVAFTSYEPIGKLKSTQPIVDFHFDSASMILDNLELSKTIWNDSIANHVEDSVAYFKNLHNIYASFYGPFRINLLPGISSPKIDLIKTESGVYNNLETIMVNGYGDSICFYLLGTAMTDTTNISFEVKSKIGSNFKLTNPSGFEIKQNQTSIVWVKINLSLLFEDVNISEADKDIDGLIRINEQSNRNILGTIIKNLNTYSKLGLDCDLNGEIDN